MALVLLLPRHSQVKPSPNNTLQQIGASMAAQFESFSFFLETLARLPCVFVSYF